jgi:hypothetical protein
LATATGNADRCGPRKTVFRRLRFGNLTTRTRGEQLNWVMSWSTYNGNLTALDEILVYQHNGVATDNFRLYYDPQQRPDYVLEASVLNANPQDGVYQVKGSPEAGLTNAQLWSKYGIAAGGKVAPATAVAGTAKGVVSGLVEPIPAEVTP